jgi:hypothetical protein
MTEQFTRCPTNSSSNGSVPKNRTRSVNGGTYWDDNGGDVATVAVAWLNWWLLNNQGATGKRMFIGDTCGSCSHTMWKMKPQ